MTRADARAVVAVEVLVKEDELAEVGVVEVEAIPAVAGASALAVAQEDAREAPRQLRSDPSSVA